MLPAYVAGDLGAEESAAVEVHVEQCEACGDSLAFFAQLEDSLSERHIARPSATVAAARVLERIGIVERLGLDQRPQWFGGLSLAPAIVSLAFIIAGVVLLLKPAVLRQFFARVQGTELTNRLSLMLERVSNDAAAISAGNEWTLLYVYVGVFALILLSGSWMVLRFVRD